MKTYKDYMYKVKENEVVIYKYTGSDEEVTIPVSIEGMPVTTISCSLIGDSGFCNADTLKHVIIPEGVKKIAMFSFGHECKSLESVKIPASVTEIDCSAFCDSRSLTNIFVDENNQEYADIDGVLFNKENTKLIYYPHAKSYETGGDIPEGKMRTGEYVIPDGVISIDRWAFEGSWLGHITIPNSMTEIAHSFRGCCYLKDIKLPGGMTEIEWDAFKGCKSLESINIPEGVTKIGHDAFNGCESLESIVIPDGVRNIGQRIFANCLALKNIGIPASVLKIDLTAFSGCEMLESITVDEKNSKFSSVGGALYDKGTNRMIYMPRGILQKRKADRVTSLNELAGMSDEEIVAKISEELGFDYEVKPDDGWECASSMSDWGFERFSASYVGINVDIIRAFTSDGRVVKLSFSGLDIDELPITTSGLTELKVLDISHTKLTMLTEWIGSLSALEVLNIYATNVPAFPESITNLSSLKELHIGCSDIVEFPENIDKLANLELLHFNHTKISKLPDSIGNLAKLRSMNLHGSSIKELPESIGNLASLETLLSYYMPLRKLPDSIGNLKALETLWITQTNVKELPESIAGLAALMDFNYKYTKIKEIPKALSDIISANVEKYKSEIEDGDEYEEDDDVYEAGGKKVKRVRMGITLITNPNGFDDSE